MPDPEGRSPGVARPRRGKRSPPGFLDRWLGRTPVEPDAVPAPVAGEVTEVDIVDQAEAFGTLRVSDIMTPRADVSALEVGAPLADVARTFVEVEHSRMPIYRETLDDPLGVVHLRDLLKLICPPPTHGESVAAFVPPWSEPVLRRLRREVLYVPASMRAEDLLLRMRAARIHMALVIDEFGGTDGLVTLEDILEALVGDISDEHDLESEPEIVERPGGVLEADARASLESLEATMGVALAPEDEEEEIDTVAGLVVALAGRVPQRGEVIPHPAGHEFEVLEADPRRIRRLRIRPRREPDETAREEAGSPLTAPTEGALPRGAISGAERAAFSPGDASG